MTIPAIKNYESRPPSGGWGLTYHFRGQDFPFTGNWRQVTRGIEQLLRRNNAYVSREEIFAYCNEVWCNRDPDRCMSPAQRSKAMKMSGGGCSRCGRRRTVR